jgi:hypothetical protein
MANLTETPVWEEGIRQFEIDDYLQGGENGVDNIPLRQLGNRTVFLKEKVDRLLQGFSYAATQPRVASTINVSVQTGGLVSVDGVTVSEGDAVLLKAQTDPVENGVYIATAGAWGRASQYANGSQDVFDSVMIDIKEGSTYGGKIFMIDAPQSYAIGTDALTFSETIFSYEELPGKVLVHDRSGDFAGGQKLGGYLTAHDFDSETPDQQDLTDYALAEIGIDDPLKIFNGTRVTNLFDNHLWILTNTPNTEPPVFDWADDGVNTVGVATQDTLGIVKGSAAPDGVAILEDGSMRIKGGGAASLSDSVDGYGRNLMTVLGKTNIIDTMAEIHRLCNNNGEIDDSRVPAFGVLQIGDYIDGLDLSAIPAENGGTAGQEWNDTHKNNRILISGFNTYKGAGDTENTKNHILFTFRNIPLKKRMNASNDNAGGYAASEVRAFLEGTAGNGTGDKSGVTTAAFMNALKAQIGDYLYTIRKAHSTKSGQNWFSYTVFLLSELEVFGYPCYGDEGVYMAAITAPAIAARAGWLTNIHIPIFQKSYEYIIKRYNGARDWYWLQTPSAFSAANFCNVSSYGNTHYGTAGTAGGCAPAFCVA